MPTQPTLAARIRALRQSRAWPQEQLANVAGLHPRTVQRVEAQGVASFETLQALASALEIDVNQLREPIDSPPPAPSDVTFLRRVRSGRELFLVLDGAEMLSHDHDEVKTEHEAELVGQFLQHVCDWSVSWPDLEPADRVSLEFEFTERLAELEQADYCVFVGRAERIYKGKPGTIGRAVEVPMSAALLAVARRDSPRLVALSDTEFVAPAAARATFSSF